MPWVLAAGYHVSFQGGLEGRRGFALLRVARVAVELANHSEQGEGQVVELQQQFLKVKGPPQAHAHTHKEDGADGEILLPVGWKDTPVSWCRAPRDGQEFSARTLYAPACRRAPA